MLVKCGMVRAAKHITSGIVLGYHNLKHALHKVLWHMGSAGITLFAHAVRVAGAVWSRIPGSLLLLKKMLSFMPFCAQKFSGYSKVVLSPFTDTQPVMLPSLLVWNYCYTLEKCMGLKDSSFLTDFLRAKMEVNALIIHLRWLNLFLSLAEECRREPEMSCQIWTNSIIL